MQGTLSLLAAFATDTPELGHELGIVGHGIDVSSNAECQRDRPKSQNSVSCAPKVSQFQPLRKSVSLKNDVQTIAWYRLRDRAFILRSKISSVPAAFFIIWVKKMAEARLPFDVTLRPNWTLDSRIAERFSCRTFISELTASEHPMRIAIAVNDAGCDEPAPIEKPHDGHAIQFDFIVILALICAEPPLRNPCIPVKIDLFGFQKMMRQSFGGAAPELDFETGNELCHHAI
jgi:hypothetical protein